MSQLKENLHPIITEEEIQSIVENLALEIERDFEGQEVILVCPLKGSILFCADLSRKLQIPCKIEFVHLISPKGESVRVIKDISSDITDKNVIIVEEIIDAGRTLAFLKTRLNASHPRTVKIVTLLDKPARREITLSPDYVGKTIDDRFVIGYGLDVDEVGRNYKDIYNYTQ